MDATLQKIAAYRAENEQEEADQSLMLWFMRAFPDTVFTRENVVAHVTSSGFVMNPPLTRLLFVYRNIRDTWSWTGGHADGERDLLAVALREAMEETGAARVTPLSPEIISLDVLTNDPHRRRGRHVSAHLHLNVSYILLCDESEALRSKPDENAGVRWFDVDELGGSLFSDADRALYRKLVSKARRI